MADLRTLARHGPEAGDTLFEQIIACQVWWKSWVLFGTYLAGFAAVYWLSLSPITAFVVGWLSAIVLWEVVRR